MTKKAPRKSVLRGVIHILSESVSCYLPSPSTLVKPRRPYVPESSETLVKPILLTHFQRWAKRAEKFHRPNIGKSKSVMEGLDKNIFAKILASPTRMDAPSRQILPSDLMFKYGLLKDGSNSEKSILSPLLSPWVPPSGAKTYIQASKPSLLEMNKKWKSVLGLMATSQKVLSPHASLTPSGVDWRRNAYEVLSVSCLTEFVRLFERIERSKPETKNSYILSWDMSAKTPIELTPQKNIIAKFNIHLLIGLENAKQLHPNYTSDSSIHITTSGQTNVNLLKLLWKLSLMN
jgi:hypothetical protein